MGGSGRNSASKAERRNERKERRKAEARQDHGEKADIRNKQLKEEKKGQPQKPKAWKRRDKDGSIILWNAIKISKTSYYVMGAMAAIVILFAISPIFEDPNYVEPERYTFAECEAMDFEDMYCIYDFKFCREYDDGGIICEYAETNPFVDLPDLGVRWTPEEQDFLPPGGESSTDFETDLTDEEWIDILKDFKIGNFILPLAYGNHDYLSKNFPHDDVVAETLNSLDIEIVTDELPEDKDSLTKLIDQIRLDLDTTELELVEVERELQSWNIDEQNLDNDLFTAESVFEEAEEDMEKAKTTYRHAQDMTIRTNDDRLEQDAAFLDYKIQVRLFSAAEKEYNRSLAAYDLGYEEWFENKNREVELNDELDDLLKKLAEARTKLNLIFRDYQFINVNLSKTCQTLIKYELQTKCPTYREMIPLFDNTLPVISGAFVEVGYDVKRLPSPLQEHWKYYEQMTKTRVVSVDADTDLFDRGVNITVQAKDFVILEDTGRKNKSASYDSSTMERTEWKNIFVDDKCSKVTVGPDLQAIEDAILHVLNKCKTDLSDYQTIITSEPTEIKKEDSAQWRYLKWIADLVASLHDSSNEK